MTTILRILAVLAAIALPTAQSALAQPARALTPDEVLREVDAIRSPGPDFVFKATVTVTGGDTDAEHHFDVSVREQRKSLVAYRAPAALKGRVLLMVERNMWIYIPGTRRPIRISPQQQLTGSVSNADVARVVFSLDYTATAMDEAVKDGKPMRRLHLTAKDEASSYRTIELWVDPGTSRPLRADFFTLSGKPLRSIVYGDYRMVLGRERPMRLDVTSTLSAETTTLRYSDMEVRETPDAHFQPAFLDKLN